jgi:hypothetical protein
MHFEEPRQQVRSGVGAADAPPSADLAFAYALISRPAVLMRVQEVIDDPALVPDRPGVHAWWFDKAPLLVPLSGVLQQGPWRWLYLGASPCRPASRATLREELACHLSGSVGASSVRLTLAVLLQAELRLSFLRGSAGRLMLSASGEAALSSWIERHIRLAWQAFRDPRSLQAYALSRSARLPLNIAGSAHPFSKRLVAARAAPIPGFV